MSFTGILFLNIAKKVIYDIIESKERLKQIGVDKKCMIYERKNKSIMNTVSNSVYVDDAELSSDHFS